MHWDKKALFCHQPPGCCSGVRSLNGMAKTPVDRKQACTCLKSVFGSIKGINYGLAAGLPGKCGVSIPYKISPGKTVLRCS
nr:PREDICTED: non-specific lipid-transfer protein 1-like [Daucus carota subsp. sativus]